MLRRADVRGTDARPEAVSAIYGAILVTAVIAALSEYKGADPVELLGAAIDTSIVFWLAHVYAEYVGERAATDDPARWHNLAELLARELPMVAAALIPILALLLGAVDAVGRDTAVTLALGAGVLELFAGGFIAGRHERAGPWRPLIGGLLNAGLGAFIVLLKVLVH
jgi:hypothetical protein